MSEFFTQLTEFSHRVFQSLRIEETESPWISGPFRNPPKGAVLHYTAGNCIDSTLRWFMQRARRSKVSAHAVIADGWPEGIRELCEDLPLIQALPAMVVQCVPPDQVAWHATWTNSSCYGIEAVNVGELRPCNDGFASWHRKAPGADEWTRPWEHATKEPLSLYGRFWEPWTIEQIEAIFTVLEEVQALHGTLRPEWILGHENVQGVRTLRSTTGVRLPFGTDKRDPGPEFPLEAVRNAAFGDRGPPFREDPLELLRPMVPTVPGKSHYGDNLRFGWIVEWCCPTATDVFYDIVWDKFWEYLPDFISRPGFGALGKLCLRILGYHVSDVTTDELTEADLESVWIFQRMSGLETDRQPGPKTRLAIVERLVDRGFAPEREW